jgi:hypothetical protein
VFGRYWLTGPSLHLFSFSTKLNNWSYSQKTGRGADNPTLEQTLVTKSEEAIVGYFSWQKLLRKARAHVGLSSQLWVRKHPAFYGTLRLVTAFTRARQWSVSTARWVQFV